MIAIGCKLVDSVRENDEPMSYYSGAVSIYAGLIWSNGDTNAKHVMVGRFPHRVVSQRPLWPLAPASSECVVTT